MKTIARLLFCTLVVLGLAGSPARAQDDPELVYDIYVHDSCLTVWLDLAPFINSRTLERLRDGVDLAIECRAKLEVPKRFWGDRLAATETRLLRLSYRKVTNDFLVTTGDSTSPQTNELPSIAALFQHLRDSVEICLANISQLDASRRHLVSLKVTTISLTDLNLAEDLTTRDGSDSPLRYLFKQFLKLTEYGRRETSTKSRSFSLSELETEP